MSNVRIYLAGSMTGMTYEEQRKWRDETISEVKFLVSKFDTKNSVTFFNPVDYYSPSNSNQKSEREAMDYELSNLRKSDVVVVNFANPNSIGTAMELMLARELRVPVVGFNEFNAELHPWMKECCMRICESKTELLDYILDYYLN